MFGLRGNIIKRSDFSHSAIGNLGVEAMAWVIDRLLPSLTQIFHFPFLKDASAKYNFSFSIWCFLPVVLPPPSVLASKPRASHSLGELSSSELSLAQ